MDFTKFWQLDCLLLLFLCFFLLGVAFAFSAKADPKDNPHKDVRWTLILLGLFSSLGSFISLVAFILYHRSEAVSRLISLMQNWIGMEQDVFFWKIGLSLVLVAILSIMMGFLLRVILLKKTKEEEEDDEKALEGIRINLGIVGAIYAISFCALWSVQGFEFFLFCTLFAGAFWVGSKVADKSLEIFLSLAEEV